MADLHQRRLDEAAAHLAVAEAYVATTPPDRQHRLRMAIASLELSLAAAARVLRRACSSRRDAWPAGTGQFDADVALGGDLRAVALMNLGTVEAWSVGLPDSERHLLEGAVLARVIGRPYLEVACLAHLGFASTIHSFARPAALPGGDSARGTARLGRGGRWSRPRWRRWPGR